MIELLLIAATQHPNAWANDYCVYRVASDLTHEQAVEKANAAKGEMTPEAWELTKTHNWCLELPENNEQKSERN